MIKETIETVKNAFRRKGREERKRFGALDKHGAEIVSSVPMQPPIGYNPTPSMFEVMRGMIDRHHKELSEAGFESPDEADDFDVEDDFDPTSPYEHNFDPPAPSEVPPQASGAVPNPPSDGPATPPANGAPDGGSTPPQAPPAAV